MRQVGATTRPRLRAPAIAGTLMVAPAALWLLAFSILPIVLMLVMSFWRSTIFSTEPDWNLDNYLAVIADPTYAYTMLRTVRIAAITTLLSLVLSYPVAWTMARATGRAKSLLTLAVFLPFWTSYVIRTFVWVPMLGRNGLVSYGLQSIGLADISVDGLLYNEGAVYVGLIYVYALFMILPIYISLSKLDPAILEASADLGAGPVKTFIRVVLPLSMTGVLSGCTMVFLLSCGAYVTPQLLGGTSGQMFGNVIASQFLGANNWALGSALSVALISVVMTVLLFSGRKVGLRQLLSGGEA
ncbi:ABC transporter permease [Bradyrhizobium sp. NP1]|uniref:ABC transporter permease n=1 Tax=Bradyrhizobium sp. NP1 TaxID=3049772 RepID=UPI0025A60F83|nr:ABC transporter permease [Bradyrhizobium sp. NP1]WJR77272.1 ABC transporter permease [Bradyrhizobium sp. NP1]